MSKIPMAILAVEPIDTHTILMGKTGVRWWEYIGQIPENTVCTNCGILMESITGQGRYRTYDTPEDECSYICVDCITFVSISDLWEAWKVAGSRKTEPTPLYYVAIQTGKVGSMNAKSYILDWGRDVVDYGQEVRPTVNTWEMLKGIYEDAVAEHGAGNVILVQVVHQPALEVHATYPHPAYEVHMEEGQEFIDTVASRCITCARKEGDTYYYDACQHYADSTKNPRCKSVASCSGWRIRSIRDE